MSKCLPHVTLMYSCFIPCLLYFLQCIRAYVSLVSLILPDSLTSEWVSHAEPLTVHLQCILEEETDCTVGPLSGRYSPKEGKRREDGGGGGGGGGGGL